MATTTGTPKFGTISMCLARLSRPGADRRPRSPPTSAGVERLAGHDLPTPPCILRARTVATMTAASGRRPESPALDVEELLGRPCPRRSRPRCRRRRSQLERDPVGEDRDVAVGDVGERAGMDEGRAAFERLEQVGLDRIAQQHGHGAGDLEVLGRDGLAGRGRRRRRCGRGARAGRAGRTARARIGHDLGRDGDVRTPSRAARPFSLPPRPMTTLRERPVVDVDDARPDDRRRVDAAARCRGAGGCRGTPRPGCGRPRSAWMSPVRWRLKSSIGHDLAVAAAGRPALDAEDRAQGRLADGDGRPLADPVQALGQADRRRRLALAERRRA